MIDAAQIVHTLREAERVIPGCAPRIIVRKEIEHMSEREDAITYRSRWFAIRQGMREKVLIRPDAWGKVHQVRVQWRPRPVLGLDITMENVGKVPVVWMTIPPVSLQLDPFGGVYLLRDKIQVTGDGTSIEEPHEVDDADAPLDYGDYRVIWL